MICTQLKKHFRVLRWTKQLFKVIRGTCFQRTSQQTNLILYAKFALFHNIYIDKAIQIYGLFMRNRTWKYFVFCSIAVI